MLEQGLPIRHLVSGVSAQARMCPRDVPAVFGRLGHGFQVPASNSAAPPIQLQRMCTQQAAIQRRDSVFIGEVPVLCPALGTHGEEGFTFSVPETPEYFLQYHLLAPPQGSSSPSRCDDARNGPPTFSINGVLDRIAANLEREALRLARLDALGTGMPLSEALRGIHAGVARLRRASSADDSSTAMGYSSSVVIVTPMHSPTETFLNCLATTLALWDADARSSSGHTNKQLLRRLLWLPSPQAAMSVAVLAPCVTAALEEAGVAEGSSAMEAGVPILVRFAVLHYVDQQAAVRRAYDLTNAASFDWGAVGPLWCLGEMDPAPMGGKLICLPTLPPPPSLQGASVDSNLAELVTLCKRLGKDQCVLANTSVVGLDTLADSINRLGGAVAEQLLGGKALEALCNIPVSGAVAFVQRRLLVGSTNGTADKVARYLVDNFFKSSCNGVDAYLRPRVVYVPRPIVMDVVGRVGALLIQDETARHKHTSSVADAAGIPPPVVVGHVLSDDTLVGPLPSARDCHVADSMIDDALRCTTNQLASWKALMASTCHLALSRISDGDLIDWALAHGLVPGQQHHHCLHSRCQLVVGSFSLAYASGSFYAPTLLYVEDGRLLMGNDNSNEVGGRRAYYPSFADVKAHELYLDPATSMQKPTTIHPALLSPFRAPVVVVCPYDPSSLGSTTEELPSVLRAHHHASQRAPFVAHVRSLMKRQPTAAAVTSTGSAKAELSPLSRSNIAETKAAVIVGDALMRRHCKRIQLSRCGTSSEKGVGDCFGVQYLD